MSPRFGAAGATGHALRPVAFLDRDGTVIEDTDYVATPEEVRLLPGAAEAVRKLNRAAITVVVVSNQSGIARGYLDMPAYERVRARVERLLGESGASIDATYICPHHPELTGPCDCRKPATLLFERAAREHGLDFRRAAFIGDRWHDVAPAKRLGGIGVLIDGAATPSDERERARRDATTLVGSLAEAVTLLLESYWSDRAAITSP